MIINNLPVESCSSGSGMICKEEKEIGSEYVLSNGYEKETRILKGQRTTNSSTRYELLEDYLITINIRASSKHIDAQKILDDGSVSSEHTYINFTHNVDTSYMLRCCVIKNNLYIFYISASSSNIRVLLRLNCDDNGVLTLNELFSGDNGPYCNNVKYTHMFGHDDKIWFHSYSYRDEPSSSSASSQELYEFDLKTNRFFELNALGSVSKPGYTQNSDCLRNSEYFKGYFYRIESTLILYRYNYKKDNVREEVLKLPFIKGDKTLSTESTERYDYKLIPYEDIMHIIISRLCTDGSWVTNHYIFDGENAYVADDNLNYVPTKLCNSSIKYYKGQPVYQKNDGIYYLIDTKDTKKYRIILPKNKKIYLDTKYGMKYIVPFTNCKIENDYLVVIEDGIVEFGVQLYDSIKRISCF